MIFFWIAVALGVGAVVAFIAREKGRSPLIWAFYGTVAPILALPHVLLVRVVDEELWAPVRFGIPEPEHPCPHCGSVVRGEAIVCRHCHKPLYDANAPSPLDEPKETARAKKAQAVEGASEWLNETFTKFAGEPNEREEEEDDELRANAYERVTDPEPREEKLNVAPEPRPEPRAESRSERVRRDPVMAERMRRDEARSRPLAAAVAKTDAELAAMEVEDERRAEEARVAEEARRIEEARVMEEARRIDEARRAEEARRLEEARVVEEARRAEEARLAEEARIAEEEARAAQEARNHHAARLGEEARRAEAARAAAAEAAREAEELRKAEESRIAAAVAAREAEEKRLAAERRRLEELRQAEAARLAAEAEAQREMEAERLTAEQSAAARAAEATRAAETRAERAEPRLERPRDERELVVDPSDRATPSGTGRTPLSVEPGMRLVADNEQPKRRARDDDRMRAPLSSDGTVKKPTAPKKPRDVRKIAALAAAAAIVGFLVPWAAMQLPGTKPEDQVKAVPAPGLVPPKGNAETAALTPNATQPAPTGDAADKPMAEDAPQDKPKSDGEEVGTAKLATPIAPPRPAVEPPKPQVMQPFQAPQNDPNVARGDPKSAPASLDPPAAPAAKAAPKAAQPKPAPKAAARPQSQDDFMSMVGRALGGSPSRAAATTASTGSGEADSDDPAVGTAGGPLVQQVQERLRDRGFDPGSIDGRTGPKTVQAIRAYQQSVGMKADGRIDMALMERLGIVGQQLHVFGR